MIKLAFLILFAMFLQFNSFSIDQDGINKTIKLCQSNQEQFKASGLTREKYNSFCSCYIKGLFEDGDKRKEYESIRDNCLLFK